MNIYTEPKTAVNEVIEIVVKKKKERLFEFILHKYLIEALLKNSQVHNGYNYESSIDQNNLKIRYYY